MTSNDESCGRIRKYNPHNSIIWNPIYTRVILTVEAIVRSTFMRGLVVFFYGLVIILLELFVCLKIQVIWKVQATHYTKSGMGQSDRSRVFRWNAYVLHLQIFVFNSMSLSNIFARSAGWKNQLYIKRRGLSYSHQNSTY